MYFSLLHPEIIEIIDSIDWNDKLKDIEFSSGKLLYSAIDTQIKSRLKN